MTANEIARAVGTINWTAHNGSREAVKGDLLDVCNFLASLLKGQRYYHDKRTTVPELRARMRALLCVLHHRGVKPADDGVSEGKDWNGADTAGCNPIDYEGDPGEP